MKLPTMTHPKMLSYINKEVIGPTLLVWNITEKDGTVYKAGKGAREDQEKVKGLILKCMLRLREEVTILRTMNPMEEEGGENGKSKKRATKKLGKARKKQLDVLMKLTQTIYFVLSHTFISEEQMLSSVRWDHHTNSIHIYIYIYSMYFLSLFVVFILFSFSFSFFPLRLF
tara:strand:+ start:691 stop:1203 length:513 start_codon:yes stop_codon:yes gene_type:complete